MTRGPPAAPPTGPGSASPPTRVGSGGCRPMGVGAAGHEPRDDLDDEGGQDGESVEHGSGFLEGGDELARHDRTDRERDGVDEPFDGGVRLPDEERRTAKDQRTEGDEDVAP